MTALVRRVLLVLLSPLIRRAGRAYLAGPLRADALSVARRLSASGYAVTVAYWNAPQDSPADVAAEYLRAIADLGGLGEQPGIAVKAPAIGFDAAAVQRLAAAAAAAGVVLFFDAHGPEDADATIRLARAARDQGAPSGVALPARWTRSLADVAVAATGGIRVRVVKGQWADVGPVRGAGGEEALRTAYLQLAGRLSAADADVAVATHDPGLLERLLSRPGGPRPAQVELLLGLPARRLLRIAGARRVPVRYYVAYGSPGLAFKLSAVLRRPRLAATLAEGVLLGRHNQRRRLKEALRPPVAQASRS